MSAEEKNSEEKAAYRFRALGIIVAVIVLFYFGLFLTA